ncbi:MAG: hypothetical protein LBG19_12545 [Prevotellaceae bacterium]|jgi:hypothetical protein|nr:hypothetical protein [Prevotellaceae bacterium]
METIDDATLKLFAKYFGCTLEELRDTELMLDAVSVNIHDNSFSSGSLSNLGTNNTINDYVSKELLELVADKEKKLEALIETFQQILKIDTELKEHIIKK